MFRLLALCLPKFLFNLTSPLTSFGAILLGLLEMLPLWLEALKIIAE